MYEWSTLAAAMILAILIFSIVAGVCGLRFKPCLARDKAARCSVDLGRPDEAVDIFCRVSGECGPRFFPRRVADIFARLSAECARPRILSAVRFESSRLNHPYILLLRCCWRVPFVIALSAQRRA